LRGTQRECAQRRSPEGSTRRASDRSACQNTIEALRADPRQAADLGARDRSKIDPPPAPRRRPAEEADHAATVENKGERRVAMASHPVPTTA